MPRARRTLVRIERLPELRRGEWAREPVLYQLWHPVGRGAADRDPGLPRGPILPGSPVLTRRPRVYHRAAVDGARGGPLSLCPGTVAVAGALLDDPILDVQGMVGELPDLLRRLPRPGAREQPDRRAPGLRPSRDVRDRGRCPARRPFRGAAIGESLELDPVRPPGRHRGDHHQQHRGRRDDRVCGAAASRREDVAGPGPAPRIGKFPSIFGAALLLGLLTFGLVLLPLLVLIPSISLGGPSSSAAIVAICGSLIGFVIGGIVALYVTIAMSLYAPAIMIEDTNAIGGLSRSWRLTKRRWWTLFGAFFVAGILVLLITLALTLPVGIFRNTIASMIASSVASALVCAWFLILAAVAYDLLVRQPSAAAPTYYPAPPIAPPAGAAQTAQPPGTPPPSP